MEKRGTEREGRVKTRQGQGGDRGGRGRCNPSPSTCRRPVTRAARGWAVVVTCAAGEDEEAEEKRWKRRRRSMWRED